VDEGARRDACLNADQTGVQFEMQPKKTISARGVQVVWVRCGSKEKQRVTAMLLADSDGNKYPVFLVFKAGKSTIAEVQVENRKLCGLYGISGANPVKTT
jgi:hypothetical protein